MKNKVLIRQDQYYIISSQFVARHALFSEAYYCERFLYQFNRYLSPLCELIAYRLSDEGFVFLVRTKSVRSFVEYFIKKNEHNGIEPDAVQLPNYIFANALKNLLISMCMHLNRRENRTGGLFKGRFKRKLIDEYELNEVIRWIEKEGNVDEHQGKWKRVVRSVWGNIWFRSHIGLGKKSNIIASELRTWLKKTRFYHFIDFYLPFLTPT